MHAAARSAVGRALGSPVQSERGLTGGDINEAYLVRLQDGRQVFVKTHRTPPQGMFEAEARGLEWLREARALRIPEVLAHGEQFLALEHLEPAAPRRGSDEALGRGLAELHRFGAPCFGLEHDNFIGRLPQPNARRSTWYEFYRDQRLGFQLELARKQGRATAEMERGFERLFARLPELLPAEEPPSRLHGDLWGGNLHYGPEGEPCLVDPAVYGGHREVDLAMMRLFGGFSAAVFAAYEDVYPLARDHERRVPLYQLYPLMVHVNLFGGSYVGSVLRALAALS